MAFKILLFNLLEATPELPNVVDNIIAELIKDPKFIAVMATAIITVLNLLTGSLRNKKMIKREFNYDKRVVAIGDGVEKIINNLGRDIKKFIPLVEKLVENNETQAKTIEKRDKQITLLLQSANIPINAKNDYLKAINEDDDNNINGVVKNVTKAINEVNVGIVEENKELDSKVNSLGR